MENQLYPSGYRCWAGNPKGTKPDYTRCCAVVYDTDLNFPRAHQCNRKRGYGPDAAYCKQHDPCIVEQRRVAAHKKSQSDWQKRRYEIHGKSFFDALEKIANGHNDPRTLAQEIIQKFKE